MTDIIHRLPSLFFHLMNRYSVFSLKQKKPTNVFLLVLFFSSLPVLLCAYAFSLNIILMIV